MRQNSEYALSKSSVSVEDIRTWTNHFKIKLKSPALEYLAKGIDDDKKILLKTSRKGFFIDCSPEIQNYFKDALKLSAFFRSIEAYLSCDPISRNEVRYGGIELKELLIKYGRMFRHDFSNTPVRFQFCYTITERYAARMISAGMRPTVSDQNSALVKAVWLTMSAFGIPGQNGIPITANAISIALRTKPPKLGWGRALLEREAEYASRPPEYFEDIPF